jgi:hypothetical protein
VEHSLIPSIFSSSLLTRFEHCESRVPAKGRRGRELTRSFFSALRIRVNEAPEGTTELKEGETAKAKANLVGK